MRVAVAGRGEMKLQAAWPAASRAVSPSTTTLAPTKLSAALDCVAFCNATRLESWSFDFICCSTWANWTSCWVNWLVSSGSSGFWFFSCVVSSCRKVVKLLGQRLGGHVAGGVVPWTAAAG